MLCASIRFGFAIGFADGPRFGRVRVTSTSSTMNVFASEILPQSPADSLEALRGGRALPFLLCNVGGVRGPQWPAADAYEVPGGRRGSRVASFSGLRRQAAGGGTDHGNCRRPCVPGEGGAVLQSHFRGMRNVELTHSEWKDSRGAERTLARALRTTVVRARARKGGGGKRGSHLPSSF